MTITLTRKEAHHLLVALQELNRLSIGKDAICLPAEIDDAMELLEARLSAPEPEPVAWMHVPHDDRLETVITKQKRSLKMYKSYVPLYTTPPQREWQGLTDAEAEQIVDDYWHDVDMFIESIEAKLREKNHG